MEICELLKSTKHICVVGISDKPGRDSGRIALMLKKEGYHVTGIHPTLTEFGGIKVYPSLTDVPGDIDIVDVFMNSSRIPQIIDYVLAVKSKTLWLQLGIRNDEAVAPVMDAGINVIQDRCIAIEYRFCAAANKS
ncbi:CoA-binding protein [Ignavibacteriales bacterium]